MQVVALGPSSTTGSPPRYPIAAPRYHRGLVRAARACVLFTGGGTALGGDPPLFAFLMRKEQPHEI